MFGTKVEQAPLSSFLPRETIYTVGNSEKFVIGHAYGMYYTTRVGEPLQEESWWCILCKNSHTISKFKEDVSPEIFSLKYDYVYCWCIPTGKKKDHSTLNASQASVHQGLIPIITTISSCCCLFLDQLVERSIGNMRCVVCLKSLKGETPSECPMGIKSS